jgi:hypothetical protein
MAGPVVAMMSNVESAKSGRMSISIPGFIFNASCESSHPSGARQARAIISPPRFRRKRVRARCGHSKKPDTCASAIPPALVGSFRKKVRRGAALDRPAVSGRK